VNTPSANKDFRHDALAQPEIQACSSSRARLLREVVYIRNLLPARLRPLGCPRNVFEALDAWLGQLERETLDPVEFTLSAADPDLGFDQFQELLDELDRARQELGRRPEPAVEFLKAVADQKNARQLALLYWAGIHHPLLDLYIELARSVLAILRSSWIDRLKQDQQIRRNADSGQERVEIYYYDTFDMEGSSFGWNLSIYRVDDTVAAEVHPWTSGEEGCMADPQFRIIQSGLDLADLLQIGQSDGIWQIEPSDYLVAVGRVFDFDRDLGLGFLDALVSEYEVDLGKIDRPDLRDAWAEYSVGAEEGSQQGPAARDDSGESAEALGGPEPPPTSARVRCPGRDRGAGPHFADPIAEVLSRMRVEPTDVDALRKLRKVGPWASKIAAERDAERRKAAKKYLIEFVQQKLSLPDGRHIVRSEGAIGDGFWVDFG
jgi:hypothetical protein